MPSHPPHKAIHHPLLPRLVELDRQLVAVDGDDVAVAEFLVEDAVAGRKGRGGAGGFGDEFAFDGQRDAGFGARIPWALTRAFGAPSPEWGEGRGGASGLVVLVGFVKAVVAVA